MKLVNQSKSSSKNGKALIKWLNHASLYIECNGVSLVIDPWLFGPAFLTGWWLAEPSTLESLELLKKCDYIFISHNHPDHCHLETLNLVDKDKSIIVPRYRSNSVFKLLEKSGFKNILSADFLSVYELGDRFNISILKSGDFRDDSGIYIDANGHKFLFSVDANFLNSYVLPRHIDLYGSAFASGASGFPLCYDNYSQSEKEQIINRTKVIIRQNLLKVCNDLKPTYFLPYAGMFKEKAPRDKYIRAHNSKNSINDYIKFFEGIETHVIVPDKFSIYEFNNGLLSISKEKSALLDEEDISLYINEYKKSYKWDEQKIRFYFENCHFEDRQILYVVPTDDDFNFETDKSVLKINFWTKTVETVDIELVENEYTDFRLMVINVRSEIFMAVIENMLPWEDFLIGFQCRITRNPNVYEDKFWYFFANEYISQENLRYSPLCGSCSIINQNPIWLNK